MNEAVAARAWRESLGYSRAELSALIGWSAQSIYLIERGKAVKQFKRYKAACLLLAILKAANNPDLTLDRWQWGQAS